MVLLCDLLCCLFVHVLFFHSDPHTQFYIFSEVWQGNKTSDTMKEKEQTTETQNLPEITKPKMKSRQGDNKLQKSYLHTRKRCSVSLLALLKCEFPKLPLLSFARMLCVRVC